MVTVEEKQFIEMISRHFRNASVVMIKWSYKITIYSGPSRCRLLQRMVFRFDGIVGSCDAVVDVEKELNSRAELHQRCLCTVFHFTQGMCFNISILGERKSTDRDETFHLIGSDDI